MTISYQNRAAKPDRARINILLVDNQILVREGIRKILDLKPELAITGVASTFAEALELLAKQQFDLILCEPVSGQRGESDGLALLMEAAGKRRVLILTSSHDEGLHHHAICLGARGIVLKHESAEVLFQAIERVCQGEVWLNNSLLTQLVSRVSFLDKAEKIPARDDGIASLTVREREIIVMVAQGMKNKQIAEKLFICEVTVRHHLTSAFNKLGVADRFALALYAYKHGLAAPPF